ncbi:MAG: hypothetical protein ABI183_21005 [Polyangiaceae bacterium]
MRRVRASLAGIEIGGIRTIPHDEIVSAFLSLRIEHRVIVRARRARLIIHTRSRHEAERLLRALAFTTTEKNAVFQVLPVVGTSYVPALLLPLWGVFGVARITPHVNYPLILLSALWVIAVFALTRFKRSLTVGGDGITINGHFEKRFVSYANVIGVDRYSDQKRGFLLPRRGTPPLYSGLALHLRGDEHLKLPMARGNHQTDQMFGASERITEALRAWRKSGPIVNATIGRAGRNTQEWIASLRELGKSDATTYRVAAVDREALFAIVEDPVNQASSRAAAAIAIGAKLDEESRARLRKSAETIADPKLRVAIEHVVDEKDEAFAELLDELAPPETKARS